MGSNRGGNQSLIMAGDSQRFRLSEGFFVVGCKLKRGGSLVGRVRFDDHRRSRVIVAKWRCLGH